VSQRDPKLRVTVEDACLYEGCGGKRGLNRACEREGEAMVSGAFGRKWSVRMNEDCRPQAFSLIEERVETRVVQRPARNIGPDHRAAERFIVEEAPRALVAFSISDVSVPALPTHMRPDCAA
jgi:hypothetical protein